VGCFCFNKHGRIRVRQGIAYVNDALTSIAEAPLVVMMSGATPISAAVAAEIARNYVVAVTRTSDVSVDEVTLLQSNGVWAVSGCHRSTPFARSRRFQLQLNAEDGAVTFFVSAPGPSLAPLVAGISIIVSSLIFLIWLLYLASLDR
jgi:hypothetical protein